MMFKRICAQLIDFVMGIITIYLIFVFVLPLYSHLVPNDFAAVCIAIVLMGALYFGLQYPFMQNHQTLGKAFFHLAIVSTDPYRKDVSVAVIIQREILCKVMSCFFICVPLFFGKAGGHEESTHTKLVQLS
ncbi:hypothetical protein A5886_000112 [Enterococcus sp. 8G7_MSG3316]|uniref:RDD domain-containing protein n=1 Tax=Candidatus Enterococcus testudinis TaxID=1834191 RepID=A0A242A201_9ENTE|nr:RDD family protein [Enterococcus sp. 8G7_MSG3316]OTN75068.1 hypothetical protein A5886_000112 [Enterococcus sp. 8G7_MSG3316]